MPKNKKPETEVAVVVDTKDVATVDSFIEKAIAANAPVETMERLFALHKQVKADRARDAFVVAMSKFQAECPIIQKNKKVFEKNSTTKIRYQYASLDSIVSQVKEVLGKNGLAYTTTVENKEKTIIATCKITHNLGHSETSSFEIPIGNEEYMSEPQKYASRLTFAKRYAFCNALGILTGEDDADAGDVDKKSQTATIVSEKGKIMFLLKELGVKTEAKNFDAPKEIEKRTSISIGDNPTTDVLAEVKGRLEILVQEARDAQA